MFQLAWKTKEREKEKKKEKHTLYPPSASLIIHSVSIYISLGTKSTQSSTEQALH